MQLTLGVEQDPQQPGGDQARQRPASDHPPPGSRSGLATIPAQECERQAGHTSVEQVSNQTR